MGGRSGKRSSDVTVDVPASQPTVAAMTAVTEALKGFDVPTATRVLLAAAVLLRCDQLITDLAKHVVWTARER